MEDTFEGYVEKIRFRNEENGYTVLSLVNGDEEMDCVGIFAYISEGEYIEVHGKKVVHKIYDEQIQVKSYEVKTPQDSMAVERYLGSGAIKGIGAALAARIVRKFGGDTFRIMEQEPERLAEVKGISDKMARKISEQFEEKREAREAMVFLQKYGISMNLAVKIHATYKDRMYEVLKENPYRLAEDIPGVGFKIADEIARKGGFGSDSMFRIQAGILYVLGRAGGNGHCYLPERELLSQASEVLLVSGEKVQEALENMTFDKRLIRKQLGEEMLLYTSTMYYMELNCARMLLDLNIGFDIDENKLQKKLAYLGDGEEIQLDKQQKLAVQESLRNGLLVITGGPGTGKTTTIRTIIRILESEGLEILLAAPTGRAAKRMSEATGYEAQTIHRLLELNGSPEGEKQSMRFERNEMNPLESDVLIVDEMSMVDIHLLYAMLKAVVVGTRLIFVGDVNQLPSVGPGNVLKDIIRGHCCNVIKLTKIFRQAQESDIIVNAHKINNGEQIVMDNKSRDFFLLKRSDKNAIISVMIQLVQEKMPKYVDATPNDIQILTPMRKGELGVERLNVILQQYFNPPSPQKPEREFHGTIFRLGDKVMQIRNNYQIECEVRNRFDVVVEQGTGVFNGDCGVISEVNAFAETVDVTFEEGKTVTYGSSNLDELELAYAITIHKSQGSEYPAVVMPILSGPRMLFNRNLLYTAVTRARKCVTIVGSEEMVRSMIDNVNEQRRYSSLDVRLAEMMEEGEPFSKG